jgi:hypothetical protein
MHLSLMVGSFDVSTGFTMRFGGQMKETYVVWNPWFRELHATLFISIFPIVPLLCNMLSV